MIEVNSYLTASWVLSKVSSFDIFRRYCSNFTTIGRFFFSEVHKEEKPSCIIGVRNGELLYHNFATGESYRAISYVVTRFNLSFPQALSKIVDDFNLFSDNIRIIDQSLYNIKAISSIKKSEEKSNTQIKIKKRKFSIKDLEYWNSFYWTEEMLKKSKTFAIGYYWINDSFWIINNNELAFSYDYYNNDNIFRRKLYFPERKQYKWFSNVDDTIVQLVDVAPKLGDILFITSSKKDAGIYWRLQIEKVFPDIIIHGVAPNNEATFVPENWLTKARLRYKRIIINFDNDYDKSMNTGINNAKKFAEKYNLEYWYTPDNTAKDCSDFCKLYGLGKFSELLKTKINI